MGAMILKIHVSHHLFQLNGRALKLKRRIFQINRRSFHFGRAVLRPSRRGSALVLVVILFMFLVILAGAVLAVAIGENRMVLTNEDQDQAYYLARSVVDNTTAWIEHNYNDRTAMAKVVPARGSGASKVTSSSVDGHAYTLTVWRGTDQDIINIHARVKVGAVQAAARMSLVETVSSYGIFDDAVYSDGALNKASGVSIDFYPESPGPIVTTGAVYEASEFDKIQKALGNATFVQSKPYTFPLLLPPTSLTYLNVYDNATTGDTRLDEKALPGSAYTVTDHTIFGLSTISGGELHVLGTLTLAGGMTLWIKNTDVSGSPRNVTLVIQNLTILKSGGKVPTIRPTDNAGGKIMIYVNGTFTANDPFIVEGSTGPAAPTPGNTSGPSIMFICNGTGTMNVIGNPTIKAYFYAPQTDILFGGSTDLYGSVIAKSFGWVGNISMHYVEPDLSGTPFSSMATLNNTYHVSNRTWLPTGLAP